MDSLKKNYKNMIFNFYFQKYNQQPCNLKCNCTLKKFKNWFRSATVATTHATPFQQNQPKTNLWAINQPKSIKKETNIYK